MIDPVAIHLKYIDQQEVKFIEEMIDADIGSKWTAIFMISDYPLIGDISVLDSL